MTILIHCPCCHVQLSFPSELAGTKVTCSSCGRVSTLPNLPPHGISASAGGATPLPAAIPPPLPASFQFQSAPVLQSPQKHTSPWLILAIVAVCLAGVGFVGWNFVRGFMAGWEQARAKQLARDFPQFDKAANFDDDNDDQVKRFEPPLKPASSPTKLSDFDLDKIKLLPFRDETPPQTYAVAFSPDGTTIAAAGCADKTIHLWDATRGTKQQTILDRDHVVLSLAFGRDGKRLLTGGTDKTAIVWELSSQRKLQTFRGHTDRVNSVAFGPDLTKVLTGSDDKTAILWDIASGMPVTTFTEHSGPVSSVAFSADGLKLLTGSHDGTAILWDTATGEKQQTFSGHTRAVRSVAFSPDGRSVLTGSDDKTTILWNASTGVKMRTFTDQKHEVQSVTFSPDGTKVLALLYGDAAILWDANNGQRIRSFDLEVESILSVAFSPDGTRVVAGTWFGSLPIWSAATGKELARLQPFHGGAEWIAFTPQGFYVSSNGGSQKVYIRDGIHEALLGDFGQKFNRPDLVGAALRGK